ncbi:MAG: exodeoxyribonuclease VII large subunit [Clostridiales bacterium]|nr:exodeoxyribonuclease VII large subunit [Clostridiales bacterium]
MIKNDITLTVTQLNTYVKMMFESDSRLQRICVIGEISNFVNHYKTGHCYFSLKDDTSSVKAVMFSANAKRLKFTPENGMRVYVNGRVSVFERDGVYQIYADEMEPEGAGALMIAFEQLREKLFEEGLFDADKKKTLPLFPKKIAVVTSGIGAALRDVVNVVSRRYPLTELLICAVAVQGSSCPDENIKVLNLLNQRDDVDLIILCRGGGSMEDLWGYNDEMLVRAVASSQIPIITGIGHETDFTLCDFAADMRAPTPSAAAEIAVPDAQELTENLFSLTLRMESAVKNYFDSCTETYKGLTSRLRLLSPAASLARQKADLRLLDNRLYTIGRSIIDTREHKLRLLSQKLKMLSPLEILKKGFVPVFKDGEKIKLAAELKAGDNINLRFSDGSAECVVKKV